MQIRKGCIQKKSVNDFRLKIRCREHITGGLSGLYRKKKKVQKNSPVIDSVEAIDIPKQTMATGYPVLPEPYSFASLPYDKFAPHIFFNFQHLDYTKSFYACQ